MFVESSEVPPGVVASLLESVKKSTSPGSIPVSVMVIPDQSKVAPLTAIPSAKELEGQVRSRISANKPTQACLIWFPLLSIDGYLVQAFCVSIQIVSI